MDAVRHGVGAYESAALNHDAPRFAVATADYVATRDAHSVGVVANSAATPLRSRERASGVYTASGTGLVSSFT